MRKTAAMIKWVVLSLVVIFVFILMLGIGGVKMPFLLNDTEITSQHPFADFIGREYRLTGKVEAVAWNDFPDKEKILTFVLTPPPHARNRFVSYARAVPMGQTVRILTARQHYVLFGTVYSYHVSLPGMDLPTDVPISLDVMPDGTPDPNIYEEVVR